MDKNCGDYRNEIPRAFLGDLLPEEQGALDRHLSDCACCAQERDLYAETFRRLGIQEDAPVPRHFFVYPDERSENPWRLFRRMPLAWQGAVASVLLLLGAFSASALADLQVRAGGGSFVVALGTPPAQQIVLAPAPPLDTVAMEARIEEKVAEKNRRETLEWVRTLRSEITRSNSTLTENQRVLLETALSRLETRIFGHIEATARAVEERGDRSLLNLYQTISFQREMDQTAFDERLNRLAVTGERKSSQTDAILETLLQVAELKLQ